MKSAIDAILQKEQALYLDSLLPQSDELLLEMERMAEEEGHPIADREVAQLVRILVRARAPQRVLEVGTNIGYSVVVMGRELGASATLESIEIDPRLARIARDYSSRASLRCSVRIHEGAALEVLPRLEGPWDFVFIDCVKHEYLDYLDAVMPRLSRNALIVADNVLWKGQVARGVSDRNTDGIRRFNERISSDPRLASVVLPGGDGVSVSMYDGPS